jgi:hypothetical protein
MPFTTYTDNALLNEVFGKTDYVAPATLYVGLSTTAPNIGGTGITEPSGSAYARVAVTNNVTNFPNAANGAKSNGTVVTFPTATGPWGTVTHFFISDLATGGNIIGYGILGTAQSVANGGTVSFAAGALTINLT